TAIIAQEKPGDGIAYAGDSIPRRALLYELRNATKPRDVFMAVPSQQLGQFADAECKAPISCLGKPTRIWLVSNVETSDPFAGLKPATSSLLKSRFTVERVQQFTAARLILLVPKPA